MTTKPLVRDERGVTAVLFALLALVLLGVGALAVDMGQVYAKRSALQSNVDLAALAAAAKLDGGACTAPGNAAFDAATDYLTKPGNKVNGQIAVDLTGSPGDNTGFIRCTDWKVELWAPKAKVDFGMAKALSPDNDGVNVPAFAAAGVGSPDTGVMPAFAVSGCDYGHQTLLDDSPGGSDPPPTPELPESTPFDATLNITAIDPSVIALNEVTGLKITGNNELKNARHVAFSTPTAGSNLHYEYPVTTRAKFLVTLGAIPSSVTSVQDTWYVRVSKDGGITWSNAKSLQVGDAVLECESAPTSGNFGALLLYRDPDSSTNERLALNMALGLDFTLSTFPSPASDWECSDGLNGAVESTDGDLKDGTNCVRTDTGLPASATEAGLVTGAGLSVPGRLDAESTNPDCGRPDATIDFGGSTGSFTINDDILTCFFTNGTTQIKDLDDTYGGPSVISAEIFESPRFFWVPVLGKVAENGTSNRYQIIDFRPAFITDQPGTASRANPQVGTGNGLGLKDNGGKMTLRSLKVVFFDVDALPQSVEGGGSVIPYLGVGPKIISLVG